MDASKLNLETERSLAILLSIIDLGGNGSREAVLDNIESRGYLEFDDHDKENRANGDLVWRNDLSWTRKHLVIDIGEYVDGEIWNDWRITEQGRISFCAGVYYQLKELSNPNHREPLKLTNKWFKRVKEIIRQECPHMKENIDRVLTPDVIKYIDDL